jgi:hypothetical protein
MPTQQSQQDHSRALIESFDREFGELHSAWVSLIKSCREEDLYSRSGTASIGVSVLRSAAVVEQTCGGITSNLWDDPFEWTLPETLTTGNRVVEYLAEVESLRHTAFSSLSVDAELLKQIAAPSGDFITIANLLLQTLARASQFYGQALAAAKITFHRE